MRDVVWKDGGARQELSKKEKRCLTELMKGGTITEVCKRAKCSPQTYYRMIHNPKIGSLLPEAIDFLLSQQLVPMVQIIVKRALEGSAKHAELVLKIAGLIGGEEGTRILQIFGSKGEGTKFLSSNDIDVLIGRVK